MISYLLAVEAVEWGKPSSNQPTEKGRHHINRVIGGFRASRHKRKRHILAVKTGTKNRVFLCVGT